MDDLASEKGPADMEADLNRPEGTGSHRARIANRRSHRKGAKAGFSVLEVVLAMTIVTTVLMAAAGALLSSLSTMTSAQRMSRATVFLETVMEDLSAQPYANLLAFNGNQINDQATLAQSNYRATIAVFNAAVNLRQVNVVLTDLRNNREIGRVTTLRASR